MTHPISDSEPPLCPESCDRGSSTPAVVWWRTGKCLTRMDSRWLNQRPGLGLEGDRFVSGTWRYLIRASVQASTETCCSIETRSMSDQTENSPIRKHRRTLQLDRLPRRYWCSETCCWMISPCSGTVTLPFSASWCRHQRPTTSDYREARDDGGCDAQCIMGRRAEGVVAPIIVLANFGAQSFVSISDLHDPLTLPVLWSSR